MFSGAVKKNKKIKIYLKRPRIPAAFRRDGGGNSGGNGWTEEQIIPMMGAWITNRRG
jgi:hypothetical protein